MQSFLSPSPFTSAEPSTQLYQSQAGLMTAAGSFTSAPPSTILYPPQPTTSGVPMPTSVPFDSENEPHRVLLELFKTEYAGAVSAVTAEQRSAGTDMIECSLSRTREIAGINGRAVSNRMDHVDWVAVFCKVDFTTNVVNQGYSDSGLRKCARGEENGLPTHLRCGMYGHPSCLVPALTASSQTRVLPFACFYFVFCPIL
ncbi:hypothetical protein BCR44DRAFT_297635 [Catenaria anguillulae PL171]|uniref:Uncharacterized protein n=1 Tax=Catenaria anguillulae PL171 TaxID=765915 RepID=A0A1Y2H696_9FUNG|nr:hypothetical protein BCR44DRAFT_297635 [Catenaria anguillulae PL171]